MDGIAFGSSLRRLPTNSALAYAVNILRGTPHPITAYNRVWGCGDMTTDNESNQPGRAQPPKDHRVR